MAWHFSHHSHTVQEVWHNLMGNPWHHTSLTIWIHSRGVPCGYVGFVILTLPRLPPTHERLWVLPVSVLLFGDAYLAIYVLFCFLVISCLGDVMVFNLHAKIRSVSEGVVPLFNHNLYTFTFTRPLMSQLLTAGLRSTNCLNQIQKSQLRRSSTGTATDAAQG